MTNISFIFIRSSPTITQLSAFFYNLLYQLDSEADSFVNRRQFSVRAA